MAFLAQIDLADAPKERWPRWMPSSGRLLFFYDAEQSTWGYDPADRGSWRVLYESEEEPVELRAAPVDLPEHAAYRRIPMLLRPDRSLPSWERLVGFASQLTDSQITEIAAYLESATATGYTGHQLFGLPQPIQADSMELDCQLVSSGLGTGDPGAYSDPRRKLLESGASDWELLLQLDTDEDAGMMWGDVGRLYFWIRRKDAEKLDFSNVWMVLQSC